jgi:hypothetical protein
VDALEVAPSSSGRQLFNRDPRVKLHSSLNVCL